MMAESCSSDHKSNDHFSFLEKIDPVHCNELLYDKSYPEDPLFISEEFCPYMDHDCGNHAFCICCR